MSPYAKYEKSPTKYSTEYQQWRDAVLKGKDAAARDADAAWRRRFGMHKPRSTATD